MNQHRVKKASFLLATAVLMTVGSTLHAQIAHPPPDRGEYMLRQMSLDEKISLLGGVDDFYTRPIERLNIPRIKMSDGPNGTKTFGKTTAYPAGVLLAATWDVALAQKEGDHLAQDAKARGIHVLLAPGMNLYRHPRNGRNFEYFGEDPLLCGDVASAYVHGLQSQNVSATIKHFALNNQETERGSSTSDVDERTLREHYLRSFQRVIENAKPGAVMCSYNRVNGTYASANRWLLNDVLRDEWKFGGIVMSDWGAVHGTLGPIVGGLDLEMPGPAFLNAKNIQPLLRSGAITEAQIDTKVLHLLNWMNRFGWLDHDIKDESIPQDNPQSAAVAREIAAAGITLLKNEGNVLPLASSGSIVVMGSNAIATPVGGGGSGYATPFHSVSIADGLIAALGADRVKVLGDPMVDEPAIAGDFQAEYFANPNLEGEPAARGTLKSIRFRGAPVDAVAGNPFSARYRATITPTRDETYLFSTNADDGTRVKLDGKSIIDDWERHQTRTKSANADLKAGQTYELIVEYFDAGGAAVLEFGCGAEHSAAATAQEKALKEAAAVIVCVGYTSDSEGEGSDRDYELPKGQDDLILRAATANPRTIVVLNAGGSVDTTAWIDRVPGFVHAYYMGQEGGTPLADVLTGKVNPSGRLPFTFEKKQSDLASDATFGRKEVVEYTEGLFVGYRGFDRDKIEPLFPFGHGLSYTTCALDRATVRTEGDDVIVSAELKNTGSRDGASVVQCYIEPPTANVPRPVRELRGFTKANVPAHAQAPVTIRIPRKDLAYWDPSTRAWTVTPGTYAIRLGFSSRDLPITLPVEIK